RKSRPPSTPSAPRARTRTSPCLASTSSMAITTRSASPRPARTGPPSSRPSPAAGTSSRSGSATRNDVCSTNTQAQSASEGGHSLAGASGLGARGRSIPRHFLDADAGELAAGAQIDDLFRLHRLARSALDLLLKERRHTAVATLQDYLLLLGV